MATVPRIFAAILNGSVAGGMVMLLRLQCTAGIAPPRQQAMIYGVGKGLIENIGFAEAGDRSPF